MADVTGQIADDINEEIKQNLKDLTEEDLQRLEGLKKVWDEQEAELDELCKENGTYKKMDEVKEAKQKLNDAILEAKDKYFDEAITVRVHFDKKQIEDLTHLENK